MSNSAGDLPSAPPRAIAGPGEGARHRVTTISDLPEALVQQCIMTYLHDFEDLLACSLTCRAW
jgi:hypothetical protein